MEPSGPVRPFSSSSDVRKAYLAQHGWGVDVESRSYLVPTRWWLASTGIPLIAVRVST